MKITVIIPNFNGEKILKICLDSLKKQSFKDYELIIVDNASTDKSIDIIEECFKEAKIIKNETNLGFAPAVNIGIRQAKGQYIALLNNDIEVEGNWLENLHNCIEEDKNIFSVSSKMIRYYERDLLDDTGDFYTILGWSYKRGDGRSVNEHSKDSKIFSTCAGAGLYRKEILDKIGYFEEEFFAYLEDIDLSYRANIHGYKNIYCSSAKVYHMVSATSGSRHNDFKVRLAARNNVYLIYRNMPPFFRILNSPFYGLGMLVKFLFFKKKGFGKSYLDGLKEGYRLRKNLSRTKFKWKNTVNYIKIEGSLIVNTFRLVLGK